MEQKSHRRTRVGRVIADNTPKTVKVQIEGIVQHPQYKKYIKRHTRFLVHDPEEQCRLGDLVRIEECRPYSKLKKWIVREIIQRADAKTKENLQEATHDSAGINP
ncbi:MAG: SSU ribosomal protein S17p (S11e) [Candidatus Ozemobacter sibiricus]|jgi:small subunit ribosomal protein S17|uniref:Small ribosomal subunit protein uS17 n=1 Tax=Candidatus Ozemobacter sibiricus TaxID=2268124 RepID=A0A367ZKV8_9BACT|nr:MAG: SSU ribosomal protein S17p (S11e) [Candidatus Ozemobacter sibiricus]